VRPPKKLLVACELGTAMSPQCLVSWLFWNSSVFSLVFRTVQPMATSC